MDFIKDWLLVVIRGLVSHPEEVAVTCANDDMGVLCIAKVHQEDCGKIIGRDGEVARAIRFLLRHVGMERQCRASLRLDVPLRDRDSGRRDFGSGYRNNDSTAIGSRDKDDFGV